jgi:hypothetical protein
MKLFITLLINFVFVSSMHAQHGEEFSISLSKDKLILKAGESKDIALTLLRSRSYNKVNASLHLSSALPEGVQITFEPDAGLIDSSTAHLAIDEKAKPGNYFIVINCTMNHKNKGVMLKLVIEDNAVTLK